MRENNAGYRIHGKVALKTYRADLTIKTACEHVGARRQDDFDGRLTLHADVDFETALHHQAPDVVGREARQQERRSVILFTLLR